MCTSQYRTHCHVTIIDFSTLLISTLLYSYYILSSAHIYSPQLSSALLHSALLCSPLLRPDQLTRGHKASSSSKKMTQGAEALARVKTCRTLDSDSPTYMFSSSGPLTLMKFAPLWLDRAFARRVFPQPVSCIAAAATLIRRRCDLMCVM